MEQEVKKTAVEWLIELLAKEKIAIPDYIINKAKEMEKLQIINAYDKGQENPFEYSEDNEVNYFDGNNYYNETYENPKD